MGKLTALVRCARCLVLVRGDQVHACEVRALVAAGKCVRCSLGHSVAAVCPQGRR